MILSDEEYMTLLLDGQAMTAPLKGEYANSQTTSKITHTCALGAARYAYAIKNNLSVPSSSWLDETEADMHYRFKRKYGRNIIQDNDSYGRIETITRIKEMINDPC
jgi:hypothetical protein